MTNKKTTEETARTLIDGGELVRIATTGANWKATATNMAGAPRTLDRHITQVFSQLPDPTTSSGAVVKLTDSTVVGVGDIISVGGGSGVLLAQSDGTNWRVISAYNRVVLCGNITFYISPTGNDVTGDGTLANPFKHAWVVPNILFGTGTDAGIDSNGFDVIIQFTDGVHSDYTDYAVQILYPWVGGGTIWIQGNPADPTAVTIQGNNGVNSTAIAPNALVTGGVTIQNLTFIGWHSNIWVGWSSRGNVLINNVVHGEGFACNHIECAAPGSYVQVSGSDRILGDAFGSGHSHLYARQGGRINYFPTTLTIDATTGSNFTVCSLGFCRLESPGSSIIFQPPAVTGTMTPGATPKWDNSGGTLAIWATVNWAGDNPSTAIPGDLSGDTHAGGELWYSKTAAHGGDVYAVMSSIRTDEQIDIVTIESERQARKAISLRAPDASNGYSMWLPSSQGNFGDVIVNDGAGNLSWVAPTFEVYTPVAADQEWYVATTGADDNPGTLAEPFLTIQRALDEAGKYDYQQLYRPIIYVADGTYTINTPIIARALFNMKQLPGLTTPGQLIGNLATPANCIIQCSGATAPECIIVDSNNLPLSDGIAAWEIAGFRLVPFNGGCITARNYANYWVGRLEFGSSGGSIEYALGAWGNGNLLSGSVAGSSLALSLVTNATTMNSYYQCVGGYLEIGGFTHTLPSTAIAVSVGFIQCSNGIVIPWNTNTYTNSSNIVGAKINLSGFAVVGSVTRSQIPGSAIGTKNLASTISADLQYVISAPSTGDTVTAAAGQQSVILNPSSSLASLTVNLPSEMCEQEVYRISASKDIGTLTISSTDGSVIVGAPATILGGSGIQFMFVAASTTWYIR